MKIIKCKNNYGKIVEFPFSKFKLRSSVYAILRRGDLILMCKNQSNRKLWLPGGGVDGNETHEQALRRECLEETGITDFRIKKLLADYQNYFYYEPEDLAMDGHLYFYECETNQERVKSNDEIDDGEAIDFQWLKINQVVKDDLCDLNEEIYNLLISLQT